mmetsp:Transcript_27840/g.54410  ORF Transcript_27840/g.54410 Transcript_27840/m.54410 type:complete len:229 (-) Transcript_27840:32-718(-)
MGGERARHVIHRVPCPHRLLQHPVRHLLRQRERIHRRGESLVAHAVHQQHARSVLVLVRYVHGGARPGQREEERVDLHGVRQQHHRLLLRHLLQPPAQCIHSVILLQFAPPRDPPERSEVLLEGLCQLEVAEEVRHTLQGNILVLSPIHRVFQQRHNCVKVPHRPSIQLPVHMESECNRVQRLCVPGQKVLRVRGLFQDVLRHPVTLPRMNPPLRSRKLSALQDRRSL